MNADARGMGQSNAAAASRLRLAAFVALCLTSSGVLAFEDDSTSILAAQSRPIAGERAWPRLEVSASSLPRFDSLDSANRTSRIDMTLLPPQRSALGLSLGVTSPDGPSASTFGPRPAQSASLDLGLHWRYTMDSNSRVDVSAWRRLEPPDALAQVQAREPSYGARVEMQTGSLPKSGFVASHGFVGLQLESGARVTLRRSAGKPMVYYRSKF